MLPIQNAAALRASLLQQTDPAALTGNSGQHAGGVFGDAFHAAQQQVRATDTAAQEAITGLLSGQGIDVHDAMIATQRADITFQLALQVRNKAVSAYQQMMGMQF